MRHKRGTLTNLEIAFLNALAVETLLMRLNGQEIQWGRGSMCFNASAIVARAGYSKVTSYHYRVLKKLVGYNCAVKMVTGNFTCYGLGVDGLRWLGLNDEANELLNHQKNEAQRQLERAKQHVNDLQQMLPIDDQ